MKYKFKFIPLEILRIVQSFPAESQPMHYDALYGAFRELLRKYDLDRDEELVFQMDFFCTAGVDKVARWISGGCKEDPGKLSGQLANCLSAGLSDALRSKNIF